MPPPRGWVQRFDQQLHRSGLLGKGTRWVVGCSGGADSVGLVRLLHAVNQSDHWGWELSLGHIHHGMRGAAADEDEGFVRSLAESLGLTCAVARLGLGAGASEETARNGRLRALVQMVQKFKASGAVVGHHADDQAETVLMRIVRGCGLEGLSGMAERQVLKVGEGELQVVRPLLTFRREQLREYLGEVGQQWREDASNGSNEYTRNRVRNEILPGLAELNPAVSESLVRLAAIARDAQKQISQDANEIATTGLARSGAGRITIQRERLRAASPIVRAEVLRYAISLLGGSTEAADYERMSSALHVALTGQGGKSVQIGGGLTITVVGRVVQISKPLKRGARGRSGRRCRGGRRGGGC